MSAVNRDEFRHNFLKSIIVRLDFQGVLETEMEKVLISIKPFAREKGFSRYDERSANQIDIAVKDNGIPETIETTNTVRRQKVYSFRDEDRGFVLDVSNSFICLTINTTQYTPFEEYCSIVPYVAGVYKESIDFFTVIRFGIRKINECLIEDKSQIRRFFNPTLFNYYDQIENLETVQSNRLNIFTCNKYHINLMTNIAQGLFGNKPIYSIRLDIDAFLDRENDILSLLDNQEEQAEINDIIFRIYVSSLTEEFIGMLTADNDFNSSLMMGVERND